jgi:O-acetyl-ADP-ribose deacetylase (regulator of RNase III)
MTRIKIKNTIIELVQGDITRQDTDAIVNAANSSLLGGGGVDGAIHRAAGPKLLAESRELGGCNTGDAKLTGGYNLKARYVIHAVGPVYRPRDPDVPRLLASAYQRSMEVAYEHGVRTIAFPAISTGVYGYPLHEAAPLALRTIIDCVRQRDDLTLVRFVLYDTTAFQAFADALEKLAQENENLRS